jgi:hypothetical protein
MAVFFFMGRILSVLETVSWVEQSTKGTPPFFIQQSTEFGYTSESMTTGN